MALLLRFARTYLCELEFFTVTTQKKNNKRERLKTINEVIRAALSTISPNLHRLFVAQLSRLMFRIKCFFCNLKFRFVDK